MKYNLKMYYGLLAITSFNIIISNSYSVKYTFNTHDFNLST